jgi:peptidoglycan/xylan/chitin deacetylase (PgdA/CDA1 family)
MFLSENKIRYVFFHLRQHVTGEVLEPDRFHVIEDGGPIPDTATGKVVFFLSEKEDPTPVMTNFQGEQLPVLFELKNKQEGLFHLDDKGNLIFHYDLLSSIFYLLSGIQEVEITQKDRYGRFPFAFSIQKQLDCVHLPLVNYYFEMIISGLDVFAKKNALNLQRRRLFDDFGFFLSHDVDRVAFYHPFRVINRIKQLIGLAPLGYSYAKTIKLFFKGILYNLNPFQKQDPWWNFDWLMNLEKRLGIRSTFFFLKQEDRFDNSLYKFHFKKIKSLILRLKDEGFEVGLHGTMRSAYDLENLLRQKKDLYQVLGYQPQGIRQHYLRFFHPQTFEIQQDTGLTYDTTLAFAEQDGYRNGYCYPFHPYDFEKDQMMDIWEIPLVMMEVSVLQYRKEGFPELHKLALHYASEAKRFGGIFSLLWHNCRLSNIEYHGVTDFYESLLEEIVEEGGEGLPGEEIVKRIENMG